MSPSVAANVTAGTSKKVPKDWPANVTFLSKLVFSKAVTGDMRSSLQAPSATVDMSTQGDVNMPAPVRIVAIKDIAHPANGQHGLFAAQQIPANSFILFYLGLVHAQDDADPDSNYDLSLDRELGLAIDATRTGNEARFINDFRGIGTGPNAEFRDVWINASNGMVEKRIAVFSLRAGKSGKKAKGIAKGDEILVSYGKGFWQERQNALGHDAEA